MVADINKKFSFPWRKNVFLSLSFSATPTLTEKKKEGFAKRQAEQDTYTSMYVRMHAHTQKCGGSSLLKILKS